MSTAPEEMTAALSHLRSGGNRVTGRVSRSLLARREANALHALILYFIFSTKLWSATLPWGVSSQVTSSFGS